MTMLRKRPATRTGRNPRAASESFYLGTPKSPDALSAWEKILVLACTYNPRGNRGQQTQVVKRTPVLQSDR
jgi:hypothetical protein